MKFELGVLMHKDKIRGIFVQTPEGVYSINSISGEWNKICFEKGEKLSNLIVTDISMKSEFTEKDLIPKTPFDGVLCYPCGKLILNDHFIKEIIVEYLDTSGGNIPRHNHPDGVEEFYLSLDEPFKGKHCKFGEFHEPFCNHTLAIKIVYKF